MGDHPTELAELAYLMYHHALFGEEWETVPFDQLPEINQDAWRLTANFLFREIRRRAQSEGKWK